MNCQWNWPKPVFSCLHICLLYLLFLAWRQQSSNESFAGFLGARPMAKKTSWQAKAIWDLQGCLSGSTFPSSWDHSHRTPFSLAKDSAKKCQASDPQRCPKPVIHTGTRRVKRICLSGLRGIVVMWWCLSRCEKAWRHECRENESTKLRFLPSGSKLPPSWKSLCSDWTTWRRLQHVACHRAASLWYSLQPAWLSLQSGQKWWNGVKLRWRLVGSCILRPSQKCKPQSTHRARKHRCILNGGSTRVDLHFKNDDTEPKWFKAPTMVTLAELFSARLQNLKALSRYLQ